MIGLLYREEVTDQDRAQVRAIIESSGFFYPPEVNIAVELIEECLQKGSASGYLFLFAETDGRTVGYTCYGPIACTQHSFDLYWIAVHNDFRGRRVGQALLLESERLIAQQGGRRVYIETSARPQYASTHRFYRRCGYREEAVLREFYGPGDDKLIFVKRLQGVPEPRDPGG
jgi:ribosomal protein S18 acetylase RimI-like enzyme